jgi:DNA-directed RNA polymerase subunit E'/Rpb7
MSELEERRRFARQDQIRVQAEHERKHGREPNMRQIEKSTQERCDVLDKKRDWGEHKKR